MGLAQENLNDAYFDAAFDNVFDAVINQTMFMDYGNIACEAVDLLCVEAQAHQTSSKSFSLDKISLEEMDKADARYESVKSQYQELLTEYDGEPEKFEAVCKFIWDFDRDYFSTQIYSYLESE